MEPSAHIIDLFSNEWIRNNILIVVFIIAYLQIGKRLSKKYTWYFGVLISLVLIGTTITGHTRNIINGYWNISDNLPLHLCGISNLISCFILFIPKNKRLFEFLFYAGIIGAFQSFFTPQINNFDGTTYEYLEYYLSHAGIMLLPIYMYKNLGFKLEKYSWLRVVFYLNILLVIILPLNFLIDSNYMYLAYRPKVNNPLIIGEWPFYIMFWELFLVLLTYLLYVMSTGKRI